jgi:hypothetical protein
METLSSWGFCHECGLLLTIIRSDPLKPTYPGKSSGRACFHSPRRIRVPGQADKVSREAAKHAKFGCWAVVPFALFAHFCVRLAFTPTHPHHGEPIHSFRRRSSYCGRLVEINYQFYARALPKNYPKISSIILINSRTPLIWYL